MSRLLLIRHGRPQVVDGVPAAEWHLAEPSRRDVARLAMSLGVLEAPIVVSSTEPKALETAEALGLGPVRTSSALCEVAKPWFDDPEEQRAATAGYLSGEPKSGWEPLAHATRRFGQAVDEASGSGDLVVTSHGTVMAAWLASAELVTDAFEFWRDLRTPDAWEVIRG